MTELITSLNQSSHRQAVAGGGQQFADAAQQKKGLNKSVQGDLEPKMAVALIRILRLT
jgi:hypothetical protein